MNLNSLNMKSIY